MPAILGMGAASGATFAKEKNSPFQDLVEIETAYANITVPIEFSGYSDTNAAPFGGGDYRFKIGLVVAEGSSITSSLVHGYGGLRHVVLLDEKDPFWGHRNLLKLNRLIQAISKSLVPMDRQVQQSRKSPPIKKLPQKLEVH